MATATSTIYIDDFTHEEYTEPGEVSTVTFALGDKHWEIDLSLTSADQLQRALRPFIDCARPASKKKSRSTSGRARTHAIREWALSSGLRVSDRGRIPAAVLDAYNAAMTTPVQAPEPAPESTPEPAPKSTAKSAKRAVRKAAPRKANA